jgi:hypothetical protein
MRDLAVRVAVSAQKIPSSIDRANEGVPWIEAHY